MLKKALKLISIHKHLVLFLVAYFLVAFNVYDDFGVTNEEIPYYERGAAYLSYVTGLNPDLEPYEVFSEERVAVLDQKTLGIYSLYPAKAFFLNIVKQIEVFHLINILLFLPVVVLSYALLYKKYKKGLLALMGPLFILLNPRFLGHIAINPQEMSFTIMFFIALASIYFLSKLRGKVLNTFFMRVSILGLVFGVTQSVSVYGYALYVIFVVFFFHGIYFRPAGSSKEKRNEKIKTFFLELFLIFALSHLVMFLTWPYIASNPALNIANVFREKVSEQYALGQKLFLGSFQNVGTFKYLGTFFLLTTPVYLILFLLLGLVLFARKIKDDLYFMFLFTAFLFFALFASVNLNYAVGVREFLFLIPILSLIAAVVFIEIILEAKDVSMQNVFTLLVAASLVGVVKDTIDLHPFQYTYFNEMVSSNKVKKLFETDYFDTSYKQAAEFVRSDASDDVTVYTCEQANLMKTYSKGSFEITENKDNADYTICQTPIFDIVPAYEVGKNGVVFNTVSKIMN